jgi:hypothetical protein
LTKIQKNLAHFFFYAKSPPHEMKLHILQRLSALAAIVHFIKNLLLIRIPDHNELPPLTK